jgi:XapX domain-containing protein
MNWRLLSAVALGLGIGFACGLTGIPAPAPPVLAGALLVVAMTLGYLGADAWLARRQTRRARREAAQRIHCGGPSGESRRTSP